MTCRVLLTPSATPVASPAPCRTPAAQNYNAALTLAHLAAASDGVIVFENQHVHSMCVKQYKMKRPPSLTPSVPPSLASLASLLAFLPPSPSSRLPL